MTLRFLIQHQSGAEAWSLRPTRSLRMVRGDRVEIGRGTGADLRLVDPGIGERHATLFFEDGRYFVVDHGSAAGTYVNGTKVSLAEVGAGDSLQLADREITLGGGAPEAPLEVMVHPREEAEVAAAAPPSTGPREAKKAKEESYDSEAPTLADVELPAIPEAPASEEMAGQEGAPPEQALSSQELPRQELSSPRLADPEVAHREPQRRPTPKGPERRYEVRPIDYLGIYGLHRPWLSKTTLSALCVAGAVLALSLVALGERRDAFLPGPLSSAHRVLTGPENCGACHLAWSGVASDRCRSCHGGSEHSPRQAREPECVQCHVEHRFAPRLALVADRRCTDCHAAIELADGGARRFAPTVTAFATDHPDFSLTIDRGSESERRVPLAEAVAARLDRSVIDFNHRLHLDPEKLGQGRRLQCGDCHVEATNSRRMSIVSYEENCQSCHPLAFDRSEPPAPHTAPELVADHILATYAERRGTTPRTTARRRLLIFRRNEKTLSVDERVERQAFVAAERLFEAACDKCHRLQDSEEGFPPDVVPPGIPQSWLPHAEFDHTSHVRVGCDICHAGASESTETADLLLAGIETCRPCHGGFDPTDSAARERADQLFGPTRASATTDCIACHLYHRRSREGRWAGQMSGQGASDAETANGESR